MTKPYHQRQRDRRQNSAQIEDIKRRQQPRQALPGMGMPIGAVVTWPADLLPQDDKWLWCNGAMHLVQDYPELAEILGTTWNTGSEPAGYFSVPDPRGRAIVVAGVAAGLSTRALATKFGVENVWIAGNNLPEHSHTFSSSRSTNTETTGNAGRDLIGGVTHLFSTSNAYGNGAGGVDPITNLQPSITFNQIIRALP